MESFFVPHISGDFPLTKYWGLLYSPVDRYGIDGQNEGTLLIVTVIWQPPKWQMFAQYQKRRVDVITIIIAL